ncbi:MAG: anion permease [Planctomycetota bacterium]|nr:MAG: anion permease [Planctomycetota bacterium]
MATALLAGVASTLLGVGGGVIMVPLLSTFAGVPIKRAASSSLAVITVVAVVGLVAQEFRAPEEVLYEVAGLLAATALVGAYIGRWLNKVLPERVFRLAFSALLIFSALKLAGLVPLASAHIEFGVSTDHGLAMLALLGIGLFAGITTSLFGVGGGIVVVPALAIAFDRFSGEGFRAATATSLAMILPVSLFGTWLHWRAKNIESGIVKVMAPTAALAAVGGVFLKQVISVSALQMIFAVLMVLASVQIVWLAIKRKSGAS